MLSSYPKLFDSTGIGLFAKPLADEKIMKKINKMLKHISDDRKKHCVLGIKPVVKAINRDKKKGIVIIAGDVKQVDIIAHVPILCEEYKIPYIWIPHRRDICNEDTGLRPKSVPACLLILKDNLNEKYQNKFDELSKKIIKSMPDFN